MLNTQRIRTSSYLLPNPGGEVARELCDEIDRLRGKVDIPECNDNSERSACPDGCPGRLKFYAARR